jgi:hypothetical protein
MPDDVSIQLFGSEGELRQEGKVLPSQLELDRAQRRLEGGGSFRGQALVQLFGPDGELKHEELVGNLITTAGDEYYAKRGAAAVTPAAPADVTKVTGMKLGTGVTAAAKSGAGAALGTYETGSNNPFDSTFPQLIDLSADTGWQIQYKTTWAAGDVTETALTEAVIVNDAGTDATSTAPNTISRITFTAINKTASDTLVITWNHTFNAA